MSDPIDVRSGAGFNWGHEVSYAQWQERRAELAGDTREMVRLLHERAGLKKRLDDEARRLDGEINAHRAKVAERHLPYRAGDLVRITSAAELSHVVFRIESIELAPRWLDAAGEFRIWLKPQFPVEGGKYVDAIPTGSPIDVAIRVNLDNRDVIERIETEL
jgi:hypothetical protein